jgi:ABC-type Na+ transport system ATPase subunit NatA
MGAKIEAKEVTKRFGHHIALSNFSLEIDEGEIFGIIGPNGAGKTTFLRILTGYWLPSSGDVCIDGLSVVKNRFTVQKRLGYVCEQPKLYTDHGVRTFLRMMGELRGLKGVALDEAIEQAIERFGLEEVQRRRIGVLSKGFRQRVSLAQALLHDPPLIVIDEPTVGLDPRQQIELHRMIQARGRGLLRPRRALGSRAPGPDRDRRGGGDGRHSRDAVPRADGARGGETMTRRLWALCRKELRTLFASPIAYIVLTAFVALTGVYFFQHLLTYNRLLFVFQSEAIGAGGFDAGTVPLQVNSLNELFIPASNDFSLFLLAVLPLVTMRVFAEERAHGTDELLLTTSIRPWEVALAKHLTTYVFVFLMLAVSAIYPAAVVAKSGLGMEHLLALYTGQLGLHPVLSEGIAELLNELALQSHFDSFARGVIELRRGIYFGGIVALGFTISVGSMEFTRAR